MTEPSVSAAPAVVLPRRIDPAEAFFWFMDHVSSMNFMVIAEGVGELDDAAVRAALARAQQEHVLLRAAITTNAEHRLIWTPAPDAPLDYQVVVVESDWRTPLAEALVRPFPLGSAPLVRAMRLNQADGRWTLALIFHHSAGDGRSGCQLLADILVNAAQPDRPLTPHPGYRPLHDCYPPSYVGDAGLEAIQNFKVQRKSELVRYGKFDDFPGFDRHAPTTQPRFQTLRVEPERLERLVERCRAVGATVHGAVSAAQLIAVQRAFGDAAPRTLGMTTPADLRGYLREPLGSDSPLMCATLLSTVYRLDADSDFWILARTVSDDLKRLLQRGDGHLFYGLFPSPADFPATPEGIAAFKKMMEIAPQVTLVSNVGRLAPLSAATPFQVEALSFALCPMFNHLLFNAASTFEGRMTLNVNYDAARLPSERALPLIAELGAILARAID
ncbi:MAG TPA: hypothetical protein PKI41_14105 [Candidatus Competibacteraceae bacterium]|nr:hypothetical protein [Candidatus Competibacteraceae bacterium]HQD57653.1 hypothetical protein [Candidatus Competibacteraceae bacterium]